MNENQNNDIEKLLQNTADKITPNVMFAGRLENELKQAHKPRKSFQFPGLKNVLSVFAPAVALAAFTILIVIVIQKMQPDHKVAAPGVPTKVNPALPAPSLPRYNRYGMTMYLGAEFPKAPGTMKVYTVRNEEMATADSVRALAKQFKMNGEIYKLTGQLDTSGMLGSDTEYLVVDGNRQLHVRSDRYFMYIPDYVSWITDAQVLTQPSDGEESAIKEFMQTYGFTSGYKVEKIEASNYVAFALSPDGFPVRNEGFQVNGLRFGFNQNGISMMTASLLSYDETANMGIISAEDAFKKILDTNNKYGYMEDVQQSMYMMVDDEIVKPEDMVQWTRIRHLDETLAYNGWLSSTGKSVDGGEPFIMLDGYTVIGNVSDIPADMQSTYIEARGQFHEAGGVKTFALESWKTHDGNEEFIRGVIRREGDQFVFDSYVFDDSTDGKKYILQDVPADIPLPMDPAFLTGIARGDIFDWGTINNFGGGGGGGGGGGNMFYQINLSGTPVAFPTPIPPTPSPESAPGQTVEGLRGMLQINIYQQEDGTKLTNYLFIPNAGDDQQAFQGSYLLKGNLDDALDACHNRPIDVWGTIGGIEKGQTVLTVDRYEIPYPDLQFQLIGGTQENKTIDGQDVVLVTADDGVTYIVLDPYGGGAAQATPDMGKAPNPDGSGEAAPDDPNAGRKTFEALIIPDETLLGYPSMRVFNSVPEMADGTPVPMPFSNGEPSVFPGPPPPTAMTIEEIELVYFALDQRYPQYAYDGGQVLSDPFYAQPVWRFSGHYEDGSAFEILVQALKQEFLLPPPPTPTPEP